MNENELCINCNHYHSWLTYPLCGSKCDCKDFKRNDVCCDNGKIGEDHKCQKENPSEKEKQIKTKISEALSAYFEKLEEYSFYSFPADIIPSTVRGMQRCPPDGNGQLIPKEMKKLHNTQDAIREAIKGGYRNPDGWRDMPPLYSVLCDPLFWQTLSKARGDWKDAYWGGFDAQTYGWRKWAHEWMDVRLLGKDEKAFWEQLP